MGLFVTRRPVYVNNPVLVVLFLNTTWNKMNVNYKWVFFWISKIRSIYVSHVVQNFLKCAFNTFPIHKVWLHSSIYKIQLLILLVVTKIVLDYLNTEMVLCNFIWCLLQRQKELSIYLSFEMVSSINPI